MPTYLEDIQTAFSNLGGVAPLRSIYEEVKRIRSPPHPKSIDAIIRSHIEQNSSDSQAFKGHGKASDLFTSVSGIGGGVWALRSHLTHAPISSDLLNSFGEIPVRDGNAKPGRIHTDVYRVIRDTKMARQIKAINKFKCQICNTSIKLPDGTRYCEAHHIQPLGRPHHGPDHAGNLIVVCPNHHACLDMGAIKIEIRKLGVVPCHRIDRKFVQYHNERIFGKPADAVLKNNL